MASIATVSDPVPSGTLRPPFTKRLANTILFIINNARRAETDGERHLICVRLRGEFELLKWQLPTPELAERAQRLYCSVGTVETRMMRMDEEACRRQFRDFLDRTQEVLVAMQEPFLHETPAC